MTFPRRIRISVALAVAALLFGFGLVAWLRLLNPIEQHMVGNWIVLTTDTPPTFKHMQLTLLADRRFVVRYFDEPGDELAVLRADDIDSFGVWAIHGQTLQLSHRMNSDGTPQNLWSRLRAKAKNEELVDVVELTFDAGGRITGSDNSYPPYPYNMLWTRQQTEH